MCLEEKIASLALVVALLFVVFGGTQAPLGELLSAMPSVLVEARFCAEHICIEI